MLIHSYFTDGFYDWALFYLETLRYYNDLLHPVIFSTVGLSEGQVAELKLAYPNIVVYNEELDMARFSQRCSVKTETLWQYKRELENQHVSGANKVWKLMTAGDDRIKALRSIMHQYHLRDFQILHTDIDVYVRGKLNGLLQFMKRHDACVKLRPKVNPIKARITIDVMGFRICPEVFKFMDDWVAEIDRIPASYRPLGYGQESCWYAYRKNRDALRWAKLPLEYGMPGRTKAADVLWCGNLHKVGKAECLERFKEDFKKRKEAGI